MANQWNLAVQGLLQGLSGLGQGYLQGRSKKDAYSGYKQGLNALYDQKQELLDIAKNEVIGNNGIETRQDPYANVQQGSNQGAFLQGKEMNNLYEPQQNQFMDILGKLYSHPYGEGYAKTLSGLYKGMNETPEYQYIETPNGIERINKTTGETKTIKEYPKEVKPEKPRRLNELKPTEFNELTYDNIVSSFTKEEIEKNIDDFSDEVKEQYFKDNPTFKKQYDEFKLKEENKGKKFSTKKGSYVKFTAPIPQGQDKDMQANMTSYAQKSVQYDNYSEEYKQAHPELWDELTDLREGLLKYGLSETDLALAKEKYKGGKNVNILDYKGETEEEVQAKEEKQADESEYNDLLWGQKLFNGQNLSDWYYTLSQAGNIDTFNSWADQMRNTTQQYLDSVQASPKVYSQIWNYMENIIGQYQNYYLKQAGF